MKQLRASIALALFLLPFTMAFAAKGGDGGSTGVNGGGDLCENRIKVIRDDLQRWIFEGGPAGLDLPKEVSVAKYAQAMLDQIAKAKIKCVGAGDADYPVAINGTPKVCRFDKTETESQITCDFLKFQATNESDQYVLIHHEFAGLANLESPKLEDSVYSLSNQITGYLVDQVVKKLAVKSVSVLPGNEGEPVWDERLFQSIRDRYNGDHLVEENGSATGEILKDNSILVHITGLAAEKLFYAIPNAKEAIQYIPSTDTSGWYNYFDRVGDAVRCGIYSYDLKKDAFPGASCRFTINSNGEIKSFADRSIETSSAKPTHYSGEWQKDLGDFHYHILTQIKVSDFYLGSSRVDSQEIRPYVQFYGDIAVAAYDLLNAEPVDDYWGPGNHHLKKTGKSIWCLRFKDGSSKCGIPLNNKGMALNADLY